MDFIHPASAIGTWAVPKELEIATLADFFFVFSRVAIVQ